MLSRFMVQAASFIGQKNLDKAFDVPQRRSQVVGNGIAEGFEFFIGGFQFSRAFLDTALEIDIQPANLFFRALAIGDVVRYGLGGLISVESKRCGSDFDIDSFSIQTDHFSLAKWRWFALLIHLGKTLLN